ncbi:MAG TPA: hybrid sensor histidine kinase/response regulator, partial [Bacteroidetes bacterium]|nr:hybrid sensor histidine kinase/response regulator [Bacteroidota bacterium]
MSGHILIADDDAYMRKLVTLILSREGFEVTSVENGFDAVKRAGELRPDLILMDVMMPRMNGFEAARQIRSVEECSRIPIVFLTAKDQTDDKRLGFQLGADDYIVKPFDTEELLARVSSRLNKSRQVLLDREAARVETLGQLIVTLAHYINNALAVIDGRTELTSETDVKQVKKLKETVLRQSRRIRMVVESLEEMASRRELATTDYVGIKNTMSNIVFLMPT